jgi:hypothetical protein
MMWVSIPNKEKIFFSFAKCPGHIWSPPNLLFNYYHDFFPWGKLAGV